MWTDVVQNEKKKLKLKDKLKSIGIILKTNDSSKSQQLKLNVSS